LLPLAAVAVAVLCVSPIIAYSTNTPRH